MNTDANIAVPFGFENLGSKNLGDLSKNNTEVNELVFAILRAVKKVAPHKFTSWNQGVSCCSLLLHVTTRQFL
jgi:hypothetical protein